MAPWQAPRSLVQNGLHRYSRNPMYIGVLIVLEGRAIAFESSSLAIYLVLVAAAFQLRVVFGEEPVLQQQFGAERTAYRARVRRRL